MLVVRAQMSQLSRQHSGASCGIDNPTARHTALVKIDNCIYRLPVRVVQLALRYLGRTPKVATGFYREVEHVRIKFSAIDLKPRQTTLIAWANFDAIIKRLVRPIREPQPQPLFGQLMVTEIMGQT